MGKSDFAQNEPNGIKLQICNLQYIISINILFHILKKNLMHNHSLVYVAFAHCSLAI